MDKLRALAAFVSIVDHGSLTAAAAASKTSLPSMVRTLKTLEDELGARLLNRTTRRIALTEAGAHYLERARRILEDVREADALMAVEQQAPRGAVRLTAPVQFGALHVAPLVRDFLREYPAIDIELLLLDRPVDLLEEGLDCAVRIAHLPDSSLVAVPVGRVRRVCCAAPALLSHLGTPDHPAALEQLPCVHFSGLDAGGRWRFDDAGKPLTVSVRGRLSCNHAGAAVAACVAGLGFGQFLHYQVATQIADGSLVPVLETFERPAVPVNIVYPHARLVTHRTRLLVDTLRVALGAVLTAIEMPA